MPIRGSHLRIGIFATVAVLAWVNALALGGEDLARWIALVLQAVVGTGAMLCAVVVARRVVGVSRWWRLLVIAATASWLLGEILWWLSGAGGSSHVAPPVGVAAYFLPPVLSMAAMILMAHGGEGLQGKPDGPLRHSRVVAVLDGLVAAAAFSILAFMAGLGAMSGAALPRSHNTSVVIAYSLLELTVVVVSVLIAMAYRRGRPYRTNYLLLSGAVVLLAASDRLVAYLRVVGLDHGDLWGGVGSILGPLMIAFAVLELRPQPAGERSEDVMDWVRSVLPYLGFLGIAIAGGLSRPARTAAGPDGHRRNIGDERAGHRATGGGDARAGRIDTTVVRGATPTGTSGPPRLADRAAQPVAVRQATRRGGTRWLIRAHLRRHRRLQGSERPIRSCRGRRLAVRRGGATSAVRRGVRHPGPHRGRRVRNLDRGRRRGARGRRGPTPGGPEGSVRGARILGACAGQHGPGPPWSRRGDAHVG